MENLPALGSVLLRDGFRKTKLFEFRLEIQLGLCIVNE